jgi:hypothetical protein
MLAYPAPVMIVDDFIGRTAAEHLFQYAITHESGFLASKVALGQLSVVDESHRVSRVNCNIYPLMSLIEPAIRRAVEEAIPKLGLVNVEPYFLEPQLTWCGDGAFFKMHTDTLSRDGFTNQRVMTIVYYFHKEPKAFTGGELLLYGLGAEATSSPQHQIEPRFDRAVFFPSWFPHEVSTVRCRDEFADGRFSISCWVRRDSGNG